MHSKIFPVTVLISLLFLVAACSQTPPTTQSQASFPSQSDPVSTEVVDTTPFTVHTVQKSQTSTQFSVSSLVPEKTSQASVTQTKTYTKSAQYSTDHRKHLVSVEFHITTDASGIITALSTDLMSGDHESAQYVHRFDSAARYKIIGKNIKSLSLSAVGGASDTTDAFQKIISSL